MNEQTVGLNAEIKAYEAQENELERDHRGKWAVFNGGQLVGMFDTFDAATSFGSEKFGAIPHLIRQVGAAPPVLPSSLWPHPRHVR